MLKLPFFPSAPLWGPYFIPLPVLLAFTTAIWFEMLQTSLSANVFPSYPLPTSSFSTIVNLLFFKVPSPSPLFIF